MREKHRFTLSLFQIWIVFAFIFVSVLLMIIGSQVYSNITRSMDHNAALRTASGYITNKEREFGSSYQVEDEMIVFYSTLDGERYICRMYLFDGKLIESLLPQGYEFELGDGEEIAPLDGFEIEKDQEQIRLKLTYENNSLIKILGRAQ